MAERNQGEGNVEADRRYRERTREFVSSERGKEKIRETAAEQLSAEEQEEIERAEREGKLHAKEEDPNVDRDYHKPSNDQDDSRDKLL